MKTALTIGFFDGVHIGHQALLRYLRQLPHSTILTFSNHPQSFFHPPGPKLLLTLNEKISLLQPFADEVLVVDFNEELANLPFTALLNRFNLSHLILGEGSVFGKDRQGNQKNVKRIAKEKGFIVEYLPKLTFKGEIVSSSRIRTALDQGNKHLAEELLGRKIL